MAEFSISISQLDGYLGILFRYLIRFIHQIPSLETSKAKTQTRNLFFDNFIEQQQSWLDGMLLVGRDSTLDKNVSSLRDTRLAPDEKWEYVPKLHHILP